MSHKIIYKPTYDINNFAKDLFKLCRKHKINITTNTDDGNYTVTVHGQWDILEEHDAVEIYKNDTSLVNVIKGTRKR